MVRRREDQVIFDSIKCMAATHTHNNKQRNCPSISFDRHESHLNRNRNTTRITFYGKNGDIFEMIRDDTIHK